LVEGFYLAAKNEKAKGETYFISSEKYYTWEQVADICEKVFNKKPMRIKIPHTIVYTVALIAQLLSMFRKKAATLNIEKARDITQKAWICDTSKAINDLGYHQKISIEDGIKRTVDWYKQVKWI
jgi:nucleoside-diphosphate-sugar epimerase